MKNLNMTYIDRAALLAACNTELQPERFKDYGPNGLQVEGRSRIGKLVSGVTASRALIEAAISARADAIFVHHGLFWRGQDGTLTGWMKERVRLLMVHDINLIAYHLPLDAHPTLGNNAQLGKVLGLEATERFGDQELGFIGRRADGESFADADVLAWQIEHALERPVVHISPKRAPIERVAWCTGGAQGFFEAAIAAGAQAYITGEISEPQAHLARECGVAYFACGHHATERYGAPAFAEHLAGQLGIEHQFIEIDNPA